MNGFTKLLILSILVDSSLFASLNITEARNVSDDDKEGNSKETDENRNREARTNKGNFDIEKILSKISGPMVKNLFDPYNEDRKSTASANVGDDNSDREARISFGRVNFDIEDILSKISGPIVQNLFNPRPHPMRRAYSEERVINRLIKKRKEKIKNHKRFQDDILSILALKRERNEEDIPSKYSPTSPKDDYNNLIIPEPPKGNWPVKITYQNKDSKHETLKKLFDIAGIDMNKSHEEHENYIDDKHQLLKHKVVSSTHYKHIYKINVFSCSYYFFSNIIHPRCQS